MEPPGCPSPPEEPQNPRNWPQNLPRRGRTQTLVRNRRYAALRQLIQEGEYFSERCRRRRPRLFRGRRPPGTPGAPRDPPGTPQTRGHPQTRGDPKGGLGLRELLLQALDTHLEDEEDEDEEDEDEDEEGQDPAEQELLRLEFISQLHQSFLQGLDPDFDYSQVDENPELDALDLLSQDLEDRYFDEEEPGPAPPLL